MHSAIVQLIMALCASVRAHAQPHQAVLHSLVRKVCAALPRMRCRQALQCKKASDPMALRMLRGQLTACFGPKLRADSIANRLLTHRSERDGSGLMGHMRPARHAKSVPLLVAAQHGCACHRTFACCHKLPRVKWCRGFTRRWVCSCSLQ